MKDQSGTFGTEHLVTGFSFPARPANTTNHEQLDVSPQWRLFDLPFDLCLSVPSVLPVSSSLPRAQEAEEQVRNNVGVLPVIADMRRDGMTAVLGKFARAERVAVCSSKFPAARDAIYNEAVEMQARLHFLRTYETYPGIIQARPIVRIHSIFRL